MKNYEQFYCLYVNVKQGNCYNFGWATWTPGGNTSIWSWVKLSPPDYLGNCRVLLSLDVPLSEPNHRPTRGGFSLVWFSLGFDVGLVQNHKRWSTLIQRIPFRSSSQVNVDTVQIPFSHHVDQRWWSWTTPNTKRSCLTSKLGKHLRSTKSCMYKHTFCLNSAICWFRSL